MMFTMCDSNTPEDAPDAKEELGSFAEALGWGGTAPIAQGRGQHAASLLPDGRVLVVGGVAHTGRVGSAELFDPATGTWSSASPPGITGDVTASLVLPNGKVFAHTNSGASAVYDPRSNTWSPGPAIPGRLMPTFTLLRSGQVLIAGGSNESSALLYDPETNTVTSTGSMAVVHRSAAAALLRDGKVLVVSGFSSSSEVPVAEIYDPASGTWSLAAPPLVPRHYATATLLPDGRVLLAGGFSESGVTNHAELYDPDDNTWTATGALSHPRNGHTATLLPSGKVLAVGGSDGARNPQPVAELYDPATGTWSTTATQTVASENHTATLLPNGRVLVIGGFSLGGGATYYARAEVYEPGDERWAPAGNLAQGRASATALLPTGQVLVAGGRGASGVLATAERYTRASNTWAPAASLATARERATLTVLRSGDVLAVGGANGDGPLKTAERYDPWADRWQPAGELTYARDEHTATLLASGKVLVTGGSENGASEVYDPETGAWSVGGTMATLRSRHASVLLRDGRVLVAGGENGGSPLASAELYDPATDTWAPAASLAQARASLTLTLLPSGKVLAVGGTTLTTQLASAELYDPVANTWSPAGTLTGPRALHSAALLPSGLVLVAGGQGPGGTTLNTAEIYDPATGRWSAVRNLATDRLRYSLEVLPSGEVLAIGGQGAGGAWLASTELFEPTGAEPSWRPTILPAQTLVRGCASQIRGTGFRGISEASYGSTMCSPTDYPLVRLSDTESGWVWPLASRDFSDTSTTVAVPADVAPGAYLVTVFTNAIAGGAMVEVFENTPPTAADDAVTTSDNVPVEIALTATDAEGHALSFAIVTPPEHGSLGAIENGRVTYTPEPGFAGVDSFVFRASDCGFESNEATIEITVVDTTPPSLTCPDDVVVEVEGETGVATWPAPIVSDEVTAHPSVVSSVESGSEFPLGTTTVTVTATDDAGNTATCTFDVTVRDTRVPPTDPPSKPSVTCPADIEVEADDASGAKVTWPPATADGATLTYSRESGSEFPLGTTTVTVTATDDAGNTATCTFSVTVRDMPPSEPPTKPSLTCPADVEVEAEDASGAEVTWPPATTDDDASLAYSHEPGSLFPVGTTTVTVTATDDADNTASCTFDVTVTMLPGPKPGGVSGGSGCSVDHAQSRGGLGALLLVGLVFATRRRGRRRK